VADKKKPEGAVNRGVSLGTFRASEIFNRLMAEMAGPTITRSGMPEGRNPHVGLNIPETSDKERQARRRAIRKPKPGTVRAVDRQSKGKRAKPASALGLDTLRRWFETNKKANPQGWMDAIVGILRDQPPASFHTGTPTPQEQESIRLRKWVFDNFRES